jgi:hypothetical protein
LAPGLDLRPENETPCLKPETGQLTPHTTPDTGGLIHYNSPVLRKIIFLAIAMGSVSSGVAQQQSQPQVKVNILNVCSPSADEQHEMASALSKIPKQPLFRPDFEVARGRSTLDQDATVMKAFQAAQVGDAGSADWVHIRREFSVQAMFSAVQYSFSTDPKNMVETLVFRVRDPKDIMEVSIEDSASAVTNAATMLAAGTPASRIKLERFGKSSVVLSRCSATSAGPAPDQSAYEPLFHTASELISSYRNLLSAREIVPNELAKVKSAGTSQQASKPAATKRKKQ